jgi:hypothetical protein
VLHVQARHRRRCRREDAKVQPEGEASTSHSSPAPTRPDVADTVKMPG